MADLQLDRTLDLAELQLATGNQLKQAMQYGEDQRHCSITARRGSRVGTSHQTRGSCDARQDRHEPTSGTYDSNDTTKHNPNTTVPTRLLFRGWVQELVNVELPQVVSVNVVRKYHLAPPTAEAAAATAAAAAAAAELAKNHVSGEVQPHRHQANNAGLPQPQKAEQ
jgi:hypothetical protein